MRNKLIIFLLLLNLIATSTVCYTLYTNDSETRFSEAKGDYEKFKSNMYEGMSRLMMGQNMINLRMLSLHHFVKPHGEDFYENCPECQLGHPEKLEKMRNNITSSEGENEWNF